MPIHDPVYLEDVQKRVRPKVSKMKEPYRVLYAYRIVSKKDPNKHLTDFVEKTSIIETDQYNAYSETLVLDLERLIYDRIDMEYFSQTVNLSAKTNGSAPAFDIEVRIMKYDRLHQKVIQMREVKEPYYSLRQQVLTAQ